MSDFFSVYGQSLIYATLIHIGYVLISVTIGFVIGTLVGVLLSRIPKYANIVFPILSIFQTIPGIVFIGILFLYLGMKPITVIIALSIYAVFPILKNTYTGIIEVPNSYKEAAKGCGMSKFQVLIKIELPLAMPTIIGGLRMSVIYIVSWAVLSSMIGLGGLGDFIYIGVSTNNNLLIIAGAIPAALLAVSLSIIIDYIKKKTIPKGLREGM